MSNEIRTTEFLVCPNCMSKLDIVQIRYVTDCDRINGAVNCWSDLIGECTGCDELLTMSITVPGYWVLNRNSWTATREDLD